MRVNFGSTHSSLIQFITESNTSIEKMNVTKEIYATTMILYGMRYDGRAIEPLDQ